MESVIYATNFCMANHSGADTAVVFFDDYSPVTPFADRPGARAMLRHLRGRDRGDAGGGCVLRTFASALGFSPDAISRAIRQIHDTGCRYVVSFPEIDLTVTESSGDTTKLMLGLAPLCSSLYELHAKLMETYTLKHRPKGRPKFGYYWVKNKYGRWSVRKHPTQYRVLRMIRLLSGRGYSGRRIQSYLKRHDVSPVPALNTIYNIIREGK